LPKTVLALAIAISVFDRDFILVFPLF